VIDVIAERVGRTGVAGIPESIAVTVGLARVGRGVAVVLPRGGKRAASSSARSARRKRAAGIANAVTIVVGVEAVLHTVVVAIKSGVGVALTRLARRPVVLVEPVRQRVDEVVSVEARGVTQNDGPAGHSGAVCSEGIEVAVAIRGENLQGVIAVTYQLAVAV